MLARHGFSRSVFLFSIFALALALSASPGARAASGVTFTVNDTTDAVDANPGDGVCATVAGKCTLRAAIQESNVTPGANTIVLLARTYKLTIPGADEDMAATGDLDIRHDVTITGAGAASTIIDANGLDRAFEVYPQYTVGVGVTISGVTIRNGTAAEGAGVMNAAPLGLGATVNLTNVVISGNHATLSGGGVANDGTLIISDSVISGNQSASGSFGGGVSNFGNLTITDTTIESNSATTGGGGIYNIAKLTVTGSTVNGNTAGDEGGGLDNRSGITTLTNVTFSGNSAANAGGAIYSGAIGSQVTLDNVTLAGDSAAAAKEISHDNAGPFNVKNTIIAAATPGANCNAALNSDGHNLSSDATCGLTHLGDKQNKNPKLGPLADNGGPTETRALLDGSPAIDAGSGDCPPPATDQRGVTRPQGPACDIGAFELEPQATPTPSPSPSPTPTSSAGQVWGDTRCDGTVDSTDALGDLRYVAALSPLSQTPPCPHIGDNVNVQGYPPQLWGDVSCSGAVDAVDALDILRHVAGLPQLPKTPPCPDIGVNVIIN